MIGSIATELLLRQAPAHLKAGLDSGALQIFGSVIRNTKTGQIAGFLQEAAPLAPFLTNPATAVPVLALEAGKVAAEVGQVAQGEVIRRGVQRVEGGVGRIEETLNGVASTAQRIEGGVSALQGLGLANLAVSAAGVGISIVGFAAMSFKLEAIKSAMRGLAGQIESASRKIETVHQDLLDGDFSELRALAKGYDEGWHLGAAAATGQWLQVARGALRYQTRFETRADRLLTGEVPNYELPDAMLDAIAFAGGLRVAALAAADETKAAREAAADNGHVIERLTGHIGASDLTRRALAGLDVAPGTAEWGEALAQASAAATALAGKMRSREAAAITRAAPLVSLERRGVLPREWLEAARAETEVPVLVMVEDE